MDPRSILEEKRLPINCNNLNIYIFISNADIREMIVVDFNLPRLNRLSSSYVHIYI